MSKLSKKKRVAGIKIKDILKEIDRSISHLEAQWDELEAIQKSILEKLESLK